VVATRSFVVMVSVGTVITSSHAQPRIALDDAAAIRDFADPASAA
jgi:hypothetical protein